MFSFIWTMSPDRDVFLSHWALLFARRGRVQTPLCRKLLFRRCRLSPQSQYFKIFTLWRSLLEAYFASFKLVSEVPKIGSHLGRSRADKRWDHWCFLTFFIHWTWLLSDTAWTKLSVTAPRWAGPHADSDGFQSGPGCPAHTDPNLHAPSRSWAMIIYSWGPACLQHHAGCFLRSVQEIVPGFWSGRMSRFNQLAESICASD